MLNTIYIFKIIHIVGFVAWFAGLFYLVRMFVYHTEAYDEDEPKKGILTAQFNKMEWRVYKIICNPAMMITWTFGLLMMYFYGYEWFKVNTWLHIKIVFLIIMTVYHLYCKRLIKRLENGKTGFSSTKFRLLNEVPTVFLIVIVSIAIFKNTVNPIILTAVTLGIIVLLVLFTFLYKKMRKA